MKHYHRLLLLMFFSVLYATTAIAARTNEQTIEQGERKVIWLNMIGAITASTVSVSGSGITATILKKELNKIKIQLIARNNARGGLRDIRVKLVAGTNRTPLYVFSIRNAPVNITGPSSVGKFEKVELSFNAILGKLYVESSCIGSTNGSTSSRDVKQGYFPVKRSGHKRIFWVSTVQNAGSSISCLMNVREMSTMNTKLSRTRMIRVNFNKDRTIPTTLTAPRLETPNGTVNKTRNRTGSSPLLKWSTVTNANAYEVRYKKHRRSNHYSNANTSQWKKITLRSNSSFGNLKLGTYDWCVIAKFNPPENTIFGQVRSHCSAVREFKVEQYR